MRRRSSEVPPPGMPGRSRSAIDAMATPWITKVKSSARSRSRAVRSIMDPPESRKASSPRPGGGSLRLDPIDQDRSTVRLVELAPEGLQARVAGPLIVRRGQRSRGRARGTREAGGRAAEDRVVLVDDEHELAGRLGVREG